VKSVADASAFAALHRTALFRTASCQEAELRMSASWFLSSNASRSIGHAVPKVQLVASHFGQALASGRGSAKHVTALGPVSVIGVRHPEVQDNFPLLPR
jgi:hypothetical protein